MVIADKIGIFQNNWEPTFTQGLYIDLSLPYTYVWLLLHLRRELMDFIYLFLQLVSAILVAPLFDGISRKLLSQIPIAYWTKYFQTYYDI